MGGRRRELSLRYSMYIHILYIRILSCLPCSVSRQLLSIIARSITYVALTKPTYSPFSSITFNLSPSSASLPILREYNKSSPTLPNPTHSRSPSLNLLPGQKQCPKALQLLPEATHTIQSTHTCSGTNNVWHLLCKRFPEDHALRSWGRQ